MSRVIIALTALLTACVDTSNPRTMVIYCPGAPPLVVDSVTDWYSGRDGLDVYNGSAAKRTRHSNACSIRTPAPEPTP